MTTSLVSLVKTNNKIPESNKPHVLLKNLPLAMVQPFLILGKVCTAYG